MGCKMVPSFVVKCLDCLLHLHHLITNCTNDVGDITMSAAPQMLPASSASRPRAPALATGVPPPTGVPPRRSKHIVHWFRKGLRLHDNPALREGLKDAVTFRCIFIIDPWFASSSNVGINKWRFVIVTDISTYKHIVHWFCKGLRPRDNPALREGLKDAVTFRCIFIIDPWFASSSNVGINKWSTYKHIVHWFRKGLRLHDNPALREGLKDAVTFRCIFIIDPWFANSSNVGINKWRFIIVTDISTYKHIVHWFRKGLRLHDNPALREGLKDAVTFRCIFIIDPWFASSFNVGINKWRFVIVTDISSCKYLVRWFCKGLRLHDNPALREGLKDAVTFRCIFNTIQ
ncbi:DNA photolyase domain-containing protein [Phthorimaea operculella]|nr:DNA photolyase domain-containing protein [Phthorimaea operculella]